MVHNGIEYADMQLIAEAYDLLRQATAAHLVHNIGSLLTAGKEARSARVKTPGPTGPASGREGWITSEREGWIR
jgi:hypothetical protein